MAAGGAGFGMMQFDRFHQRGDARGIGRGALALRHGQRK